MDIDQKVIARLDELIQRGTAVLQTKWGGVQAGPGWMSADIERVDYQAAHEWGISSLNLLGRAFDKSSDHYTRFNALFPEFEAYDAVLKALGILKGAKDDYEHGYLFETRRLIEAEVFDDFLEQGEHLFQGGYEGPAAVIAGSVLEDGLRKLCHREGIALGPQPKLDAMNADLAKNGAYDKLTQKRITVLADIRNKAAHGQWSQFTKDDVSSMLRDVRSFMEKHFM